eukprot:gene20918-25090_t
MNTTATEAYVNEAISNLTATLTEKDTELEGSIGAIGGLGDVLWLLLGAYMVFFMQASRFNADGTVSDLHRGHNAVLQALDVGPALNGILAGLVGITAPCVVVEPWAAAFIGFVAAFVYYGSSKMLLKLKIDDVLEASPVHFFCGAWGCLSVGFFATDIYVNNGVNGAYAADKDNGDSGNYGAFYGGGGEQLGTQIVGVLAIAAWTCGTSALMFFGLSKAGVLRVSPEDEQTGLDDSHHGGSAYDMQTMQANSGTVKVEAV